MLSGEITPGDAATVRVLLERDGTLVRGGDFAVAQFAQGLTWRGLPIELWWPNLEGEQPLYTVTCVLLDADGHQTGPRRAPCGLQACRLAAVRGRAAGSRSLGLRRQRPSGLHAGRELRAALRQLRGP